MKTQNQISLLSTSDLWTGATNYNSKIWQLVYCTRVTLAVTRKCRQLVSDPVYLVHPTPVSLVDKKWKRFVTEKRLFVGSNDTEETDDPACQSLPLPPHGGEPAPVATRLPCGRCDANSPAERNGCNESKQSTGKLTIRSCGYDSPDILQILTDESTRADVATDRRHCYCNILNKLCWDSGFDN